MNQQNPFKWRHFEAEIILLCVRWYLRYALSYRDLEEMMRERGLQVDHTTIYRWVQHYASELDKRSRPHLKACNDSWRVDETYIKVKKVWMYLSRAADSEGNTLEFLLSPTRDAEAAKRFFVKALHATAGSASRACPADEKEAEAPRCTEPAAGPAASGAGSVGITPKTLSLRAAPRSVPRVINVDKNAAYPKAIADLKASGVLPESVELRQIKYLNNLVEQDHRFIKRLVKPGLGFFSVETARRRGDARGEQRRRHRAGHLHRPPVWSGCLSSTGRWRLHVHRVSPRVFATQPPLLRSQRCIIWLSG